MSTETNIGAIAPAQNPATTQTAVTAPPAPAKLTIRQQIESPQFAEAVRKALPRHLTPDRFIRVALTAITRTPKLAQCDQASFFAQLLTLSQLGLEPDGRRAHLIPFENRKRGVVECQLIVDWKGLAELAMRSGIVANLHADVVRKGDLLEYSAGKVVKHIPHFLRSDEAKPEQAGETYAVYALAEFKDGTTKADVLSVDEVQAVRSRSSAGQSGPWVTDWNEMAKKTAFRRLSKWLPLSPEFRDAIEADDDKVPHNVTPISDKLAGGLAGLLDTSDAVETETETKEETT
jgi:recombination protein RecT